MPTAPPNSAGIEICYETHGDPDGVPLLFVMGLGAQLQAWDIELVEAFVDRGFFAIRFDNRDVGLSTKPDVGDVNVTEQFMAALGGAAVAGPYLLTDMAADAMGVLDHLGLPAAHVVGASMGGMIAQTIAIEYPQRVLTLTSIMSTTGDPDVGQPDPSVLPILLAPPATGRDEAVAQGVEGGRAVGSPDHFDEIHARKRAAEAYDRCFYPAGVGHQLLAILASGSRTEALRQLDVPTLVIHGDVDPLVTPSGGQRTAEVIPGAELMMIEGMGHDLPAVFWPQIIERIIGLAARVSVAAK